MLLYIHEKLGVWEIIMSQFGYENSLTFGPLERTILTKQRFTMILKSQCKNPLESVSECLFQASTTHILIDYIWDKSQISAFVISSEFQVCSRRTTVQGSLCFHPKKVSLCASPWTVEDSSTEMDFWTFQFYPLSPTVCSQTVPL